MPRLLDLPSRTDPAQKYIFKKVDEECVKHEPFNSPHLIKYLELENDYASSYFLSCREHAEGSISQRRPLTSAFPAKIKHFHLARSCFFNRYAFRAATLSQWVICRSWATKLNLRVLVWCKNRTQISIVERYCGDGASETQTFFGDKTGIYSEGIMCEIAENCMPVWY